MSSKWYDYLYGEHLTARKCNQSTLSLPKSVGGNRRDPLGHVNTAPGGIQAVPDLRSEWLNKHMAHGSVTNTLRRIEYFFCEFGMKYFPVTVRVSSQWWEVGPAK